MMEEEGGIGKGVLPDRLVHFLSSFRLQHSSLS